VLVTRFTSVPVGLYGNIADDLLGSGNRISTCSQYAVGLSVRGDPDAAYHTQRMDKQKTTSTAHIAGSEEVSPNESKNGFAEIVEKLIQRKIEKGSLNPVT
jgi:hypothetical protein